MTEILSTTNYDQFKLIDKNRPVKSSAVDLLVKSIQSRNLLHKRPINVKGDLSVIDGQHRLEAARKLCIPIYYTINDDMVDDDMPLLNSTQRAWTYADFLNYYVKCGHPEYVKLHYFIKETRMSLTQALSMVVPHNSIEYVRFKAGEFVYPTGEKLDEINAELQQIEKVKDLVRQKKMTQCAFMDTATFARAIHEFLSLEGVNLEQFLGRLIIKIDFFDARSKKVDYIRMFVQIYNYRNKEPITAIVN